MYGICLVLILGRNNLYGIILLKLNFVTILYISYDWNRMLKEHYIYNILEACTDMSDNEPHRKVGDGRAAPSGSLVCVMVSTLTLNARHDGSIPALATLFPIFFSPRHYVWSRTN